MFSVATFFIDASSQIKKWICSFRLVFKAIWPSIYNGTYYGLLGLQCFTYVIFYVMCLAQSNIFTVINSEISASEISDM